MYTPVRNMRCVCKLCRTTAKTQGGRGIPHCPRCAKPMDAIYASTRVPSKGDDKGWRRLQTFPTAPAPPPPELPDEPPPDRRPNKRKGGWITHAEVLARAEAEGLEIPGPLASNFSATTFRMMRSGLLLYWRPAVEKLLEKQRVEAVRAVLSDVPSLSHIGSVGFDDDDEEDEDWQ